MADFGGFREPGRSVDRAIQYALRDTDSRALAVALVAAAKADREIFYRNMSARAVDMLGEEIAELERLPAGTFDRTSAANQEALLRKMVKYRAMTEENEALTPESLPLPRWEDEEGLISALVRLRRYADRHGGASLEPLLREDLHPLLKKGLRLYVDDWDPAVVQSVLEQTRESMVIRYRNTLDIVIEGVAALFGHDLPQVVEEKLEAFRLSDPCHEPSRGS